jgi:hypothetical protein
VAGGIGRGSDFGDLVEELVHCGCVFEIDFTGLLKAAGTCRGTQADISFPAANRDRVITSWRAEALCD